ncbi:MAG TPA: hypothetical protein VHH36_03215, partial [Candidatus Thermoplasmatota archaeon]|nr:hypothetical protein [Candidatus Thermoplasmatota archaeon]
MSPAVRWLPAAGTLLLLLLGGAAAAQLPVDPLPQSHIAVAISGEQTFVQVPYNGVGRGQLVVVDLSQDSGATNADPDGVDANLHNVQLTIVNDAEIVASGWLVSLGETSFQMTGGRQREVPVIVQTTPQVSTQDVEAIVVAEMFDPATGRRVNATTTVVGDLSPYSRATARMLTFPQVAGQFETVQFEVRITNDAVFPDVFSVEAFADKDDFILIAPPNVFVPPLSSRSFNVSVRTPYGVPYEFGESTTLAVRMTSVYTGQTFPVVGILRVEGFYFSTAWWPLLA